MASGRRNPDVRGFPTTWGGRDVRRFGMRNALPRTYTPWMERLPAEVVFRQASVGIQGYGGCGRPGPQEPGAERGTLTTHKLESEVPNGYPEVVSSFLELQYRNGALLQNIASHYKDDIAMGGVVFRLLLGCYIALAIVACGYFAQIATIRSEPVDAGEFFFLTWGMWVFVLSAVIVPIPALCGYRRKFGSPISRMARNLDQVATSITAHWESEYAALHPSVRVQAAVLFDLGALKSPVVHQKPRPSAAARKKPFYRQGLTVFISVSKRTAEEVADRGRDNWAAAGPGLLEGKEDEGSSDMQTNAIVPAGRTGANAV